MKIPESVDLEKSALNFTQKESAMNLKTQVDALRLIGVTSGIPSQFASSGWMRRNASEASLADTDTLLYFLNRVVF